MSLSIRRIYHKVDWPPKRYTLKEAHVPYSASLVEMLSAHEVVILEKQGQPVAALIPIEEYEAYQAWCEAEKRYQAEEA